MGCDIHAYVEVKRYRYDDQERKNGVWVNADKWTRDVDAILFPDDYKRKFIVDYDDRIYAGRHYYLFAILAGVRNAWELKPISEPKGLPNDISEEVKREAEYWDSDGHSHSYLTLSEILAYEWDKKEEANDWIFNDRELDELKEKHPDIRISKAEIGFNVRYKTTIRDIFPKFNETIDKLKGFLKENYRNPAFNVTPDDIRLVFWFDN